MSRGLVGVTPRYSLEECLLAMSKMKVRHLPVLQDGAIVHLLSLSEIAAVLVEDKDFVIHELIKYISGPHIPSPGKVEPEVYHFESWSP